MIAQQRDKRDWTLLIFIIPIGVILMCIAGQLAIRILPRWSVAAGMESNLDPNAPAQPFSIFQPIMPQILTPMGWADIYLTPGSEIVFPPFFIFDPPGASSATPVPATPMPTSTSGSAHTATSTFPSQPTGTSGQIATHTPMQTLSDPPTPVPPTPVPPTSVPPTSVSPTATPTGFPSTPPPGYVIITPPPGILDPPDGIWHPIEKYSYMVLDISATPIIVDGDPSWDLAFYERLNGSGIYLDNIVIGISNEADGSVFFIVFYWGDYAGTPELPTNDLNTNITHVIEKDNVWIPGDELYDSPNFPSSGILINVDGAASQPPPGTYNYLVIIAPDKPTSGAAQVDAIEIFP
jgi:hypothetical protein